MSSHSLTGAKRLKLLCGKPLLGGCQLKLADKLLLSLSKLTQLLQQALLALRSGSGSLLGLLQLLLKPLNRILKIMALLQKQLLRSDLKLLQPLLIMLSLLLKLPLVLRGLTLRKLLMLCSRPFKTLIAFC
ncbi:hypothetical protein D3C78_1277470 [compost metagenome]